MAALVATDILPIYLPLIDVEMKHEGTIDDLRTIIAGAGHTIESVAQKDHLWQIRTKDNAICNWYPSTGTIQFQGKAAVKTKLRDDVSSYVGGSTSGAEVAEPDVPFEPTAPTRPKASHKKVFVVHGHDSVAREQLELILHKLDVFPFVLANTGGGGLTIIEALEKEFGPSDDSARFGIVLMTPDDVGYSKAEGSDAVQPRARQNVVLEMGMLISALGRGNVAILKKGHLEVPSDAQGILYIPFNEHVKETVPKLADRLREAGFVLNPSKITLASA